MDYLELLKESFEVEKEENSDLEPYGYLADHIFDFTTYDDEASNRMGESTLAFCSVISNGNTFDYIDDEANYNNYLNCVNLTFFANKLDWGTSVRGAWWNLYNDEKFELTSCGLYKDKEQLRSIKFNKGEWDLFVHAMCDFVKLTNEN